MTDNAWKATFSLKDLNAGKKVTIGGKNIPSVEAKDIQALVDARQQMETAKR